MRRFRFDRRSAGLFLAAVVAAGCGGDDDGGASGSAGSGAGGSAGSGAGGSAGGRGGFGGGGEGGGEAVATYGDRTLPGRLLVNKGHRVGTAAGHAAFDLTTGQRTVLPASPAGVDDERWSTGARADTLLRLQSGGVLTRYAASTLAAQGAPITLPSSVNAPQLSADGRYVLAFDENTLTVYAAADGAVVEDASNLDGFSVIGVPAAWLPDGRYVYLAGKTLYATRPGDPDTTELATLALPGPTPSGVMNVDLAASPDGRRLALSWLDLDTEDADLWVVNVDGSDLKQLTRSTQPDALDYAHASPAWSPDSKWVAGVLYMSATSSSPVYPDEPFLGARITGSTGCIDQVFVVDPDAGTVQLTWPTFDAAHGIKVRADGEAGGQWLATCAARTAWLP